MSAVQTHPLLDDYLRRLHAAAWVLPPDRRDELVAEIRRHAEDALAGHDAQDEATIRNVLERLGPPEEIIAAEVEGSPEHTLPAAGAARATAGAPTSPARPRGSARRLGGVEITALVALAVGGIVVPILGVLVGLVLAWTSALWTRVDKAVATLLPVGTSFVAVIPIVGQVMLGRGFRLSGGMPFGGHRFTEMMPFLPGAMPFAMGGLARVAGAVALGGLLAAGYLAIQASRRTSGAS